MRRESIHFDEISIRGICGDLAHSILYIILAAAALWLGATGVGNLTYTPQYTSSATVVVTARNEYSTYSSLSMANEMAGVFSEVFQSDALREKILEDTGETIQGTITCSAIEETNLLVLNASSPDPRQAYLLMNSALKNYEDVSEYVFSNASLEIVQEPEVPEAPSSESRLIAMRELLAAAGAAGMILVILLFYVFRFTVKNEISAARQLDGKVRGVIPYEKKTSFGKKNRSKQALLLSSPLVSMPFAEASRKMEAQVEQHMKQKNLKVLLVASISENEGKSTVAANLALALAEKHKKVLLVDSDLHKPALYKIFSRKQQGHHSLDEILKGEINWRDALITERKHALYSLLQFRPVADPAKVTDLPRLEELIRVWREEMDYVIIDSSPIAVSTNAELWMQLADTALLVIRQDWSDVRVINDAVDLIWQSGVDFSGFVLNAFQSEWTQPQREYRYKDYASYKSYASERK